MFVLCIFIFEILKRGGEGRAKGGGEGGEGREVEVGGEVTEGGAFGREGMLESERILQKPTEDNQSFFSSPQCLCL